MLNEKSIDKYQHMNIIIQVKVLMKLSCETLNLYDIQPIISRFYFILKTKWGFNGRVFAYPWGIYLNHFSLAIINNKDKIGYYEYYQRLCLI